MLSLADVGFIYQTTVDLGEKTEEGLTPVVQEHRFVYENPRFSQDRFYQVGGVISAALNGGLGYFEVSVERGQLVLTAHTLGAIELGIVYREEQAFIAGAFLALTMDPPVVHRHIQMLATDSK